MVNDKERCEAAARLRKYIRFAKECDQNNEGEMISENGNVMFRDIAEAVGGDYANFIDSYEETLTKLADLIEPEPERTCRMEHREGEDKPFCSNCGEEMDAYTCEWTEPMEYSYPFCYACGAKVQS